MLLLSIPTPCHEKWDEMTPNGQGAFCSVCSKTVVDFTALSDKEVQNYFLHKKEEKTCGRFRNDQLAGKDNSLNKLLATSIPFWKKFLAMVVIVFGSLLSSCNQVTLGKPAVNSQKTELKDLPFTTTGIILSEIEPYTNSPIDTVLTKKCSFEAIGITEEIFVDDTIIQGDVKMSPVTQEEPLLKIQTIDKAIKISLDKHGNPTRE
ncbi:MAG: hypothetical protein JNN00_18695 [Chitinophagaceae bacterium]|nr:hypothetical protein [Chitinophagaceae bacterium]